MNALKRFAKIIIIIAFFIVELYALFAVMEHIDKNKFNKDFYKKIKTKIFI